MESSHNKTINGITNNSINERRHHGLCNEKYQTNYYRWNHRIRKNNFSKIIEEKLTHFGGNKNQVKVKIIPEVVLSDQCETTLQQYYKAIEKVEENQEPLEKEKLKAELEYYAIKIQIIIKELYMIEYSNITKEAFKRIKYDYIIHDRTLLSTKIFMKLIIDKKYISEL